MIIFSLVLIPWILGTVPEDDEGGAHLIIVIGFGIVL